VAAAGAADHEFGGKDDAIALEGVFAAGDALEEEVGGHFADLVDGLADDGERGLEDVGDIEIVEAGEGDMGGDVDAQGVERVQQVAHGEVVSGEQGGGGISAGEHGVQGGNGFFRRRALDVVLRRERGGGHGVLVSGVAGLHGEEGSGEAEEGHARVAVGDEVGHAGAGASAIIDDNGIEAGVGRWAIEGDDVDFGELVGAEVVVLSGRGNDDHAVDAAAEHHGGLLLLDVAFLVGGGDEDGVSVGVGDSGDGVGAGGEEGIVKVGQDEGDGFGMDGSQAAGQFVGLVVEHADGALDAFRGIAGDIGAAAEEAGNGHFADAGELGDIGHCGGARDGRLAIPELRHVRR
jgi:hypothetical protein